MIVKRARILGQCAGVRLAVDKAYAAAKSGRRVFSLGPLIHNPRAVADLEAAGVRVLGEGELDERVRGAVVVIRAHGVPPALRDRLEILGAEILDATCPRVLSSQRRARERAARGDQVILVGDAGHGEVVGIAGQAPGIKVVGSPAEAAALELDPSRAVALIAQTTISRAEYEAVRDAIAARVPLVEALDTICPATSERQAALAELATGCDHVVVVGGKNSANTRRLAAAALESGIPTSFVELPGELPEEVFGLSVVGLTAGASTPDALIDEVEAALLRGAAARA